MNNNPISTLWGLDEMMDAEQPNEHLLGKSGLLCYYYYDYTNGS